MNIMYRNDMYANKHCVWMMNIMYLQNNKNTFLYWMMNIV